MTYPCQQLDAVPLDAVQTSRLVQLLGGDGLGGIQAALVDPRLDAVEVDGRHFDLEGVVLAPSSLGLGDAERRLAALEACGHLSVGMLALLTAACRLALPRRRASSTPDPLAVGALVVRQRRQNGRASSLGGPSLEGSNCGCSHGRLVRERQERECEARGL